jgi:hypothetical protein
LQKKKTHKKPQNTPYNSYKKKSTVNIRKTSKNPLKEIEKHKKSAKTCLKPLYLQKVTHKQATESSRTNFKFSREGTSVLKVM